LLGAFLGQRERDLRSHPLIKTLFPVTKGESYERGGPVKEKKAPAKKGLCLVGGKWVKEGTTSVPKVFTPRPRAPTDRPGRKRTLRPHVGNRGVLTLLFRKPTLFRGTPGGGRGKKSEGQKKKSQESGRNDFEEICLAHLSGSGFPRRERKGKRGWELQIL